MSKSQEHSHCKCDLDVTPEGGVTETGNGFSEDWSSRRKLVFFSENYSFNENPLVSKKNFRGSKSKFFVWSNRASVEVFFISNEFMDVARCLTGLVDSLDDKSDLFGDVSDTMVLLTMPKHSSDGRKRTWYKTCKSLSGSVMNQPTSVHDCWFVCANHSSGKSRYVHYTKLTGKGQPWSTPRMVYLLLNPGDRMVLGKNGKRYGPVIAHRCGHGQASAKGGPVCINPFHLTKKSQRENRSDERCGHGCRKLCPHKPHCLFTWQDTGRVKKCFSMKSTLPDHCSCKRECRHLLNM